MSEERRGRDDRLDDKAPASPLKSTAPTPTATPNKSEPAEDPSSEQHRDADALAAQAFALANPASEVLEDAPGAAPTAGEPGSERWGDIDNELDMALGTGEAAEDPPPRKVIDGPGYVEFYFSDMLGRSKVPHWAALGAFHDAAQSIAAGAVYLASLRARLPDSVLGKDRDFQALAAYNVGPYHLDDARTLAARLGEDPDRWSSLREVLPLLANERYYRDLPYGYARGSEPVRYVSRIRNFRDILHHHQDKSGR